MTKKQFKSRFLFAVQYIPFTINTILCIAAVWLGYHVLHKPKVQNPDEDIDSFRQIIVIMGKVTLVFLVALIIISLLSTIISWLYYLWLNERKPHKLQVSFTNETKEGKTQKLYMDNFIEGVKRPLLGFVKGRLVYDDLEMTDKFSLLSNKRKENGFQSLGISGRSRLLLPDIKEYNMKGGFIYFEDMLRLVSIAVKQPISGQFYQPPVLAEDQDHEVFPKKTETLDVRIEQMRKVEGEQLNYKDFEAGDDVRRIVWKVYAKNKELVVRIPERFEPFASHLYFYASFDAAVKESWLGDGYLKEMLNYYKNNVWTVYDTLAKKEWQMRYIPDQKLVTAEDLPEGEKASRTISNSNWQNDTPVSSYFNTKTGTVLCVSSLTDIKELQAVLDQCDGSTVVYFVKLSRVFKHFVAWGWLQRIIFLPPKDRLARLRTSWTFSPMRLQIQKREKEIEELLKKSSVVNGVL